MNITYYVAGPMRNHPCFNFPLFDEVSDELRRKTINVINPADHDREVAKQNGAPPPEECNGYEDGDLAAYHVDMKTTFEDLLGWDLVAIIEQCDGVVMLPGWEKSTGAGHEKYVAEATGKDVLYAYQTSQGHWLFLGFDLYAREREAKVQPLHVRYPDFASLQGKTDRERVEDLTNSPLVRREAAQKIEAETVIVGLMGYAQVGKDTLAKELCEAYGFKRLAFADTLRECLYVLNPAIPYDFGGYTMLQNLVDKVGWDKAKQKREVRALLQRMGTEVGRDILGTDIWVNTTLSKVESGGKYVITDVRFPNEFAAIKARGGRTIRIMREGYGPVNGHWSETALDAYQSDVRLTNNSEPSHLLNEAAQKLGLA